MQKYNINDLTINRFESLRLAFRPISYKDISAVYEYGKDFKTCMFLNWGPYKSIAEAQKFVENKVLNGDLQWVIVQKDKDKVIGAIRLYDFDECKKSASISYVLNRGYSGQGYMTEGLKKMFEIGKEVLGLKKIYAYYVEGNRASEKVMQRAEMEKDANFLEDIEIKGKEYKEYRYYKEMKE